MIHMVYGDLSGDESGILTVGVYLGAEAQWMDAIAEWSRVLDDANVTEFHATDFYSGHGQFAGDEWHHDVAGRRVVGGPKHQEFAKRFTGVASDAGLIGFAFAIDAPSFRNILAPTFEREPRKYKASHPKTFIAMMGLREVSNFLERLVGLGTGSIQVIFESEQGAGKFVDFFNESRERGEPWVRWFASFTTAPKSFLPLQIADLLAHEGWRREKENRSLSPRRYRKSFLRMIGGGKVMLRSYDEASLKRNAKTLGDLIARYPDGRVPLTEDPRNSPPFLHGNGVNDDTEAVQWHIDRGIPLPPLPVGGAYRVIVSALRRLRGGYESPNVRPDDSSLTVRAPKDRDPN